MGQAGPLYHWHRERGNAPKYGSTVEIDIVGEFPVICATPMPPQVFKPELIGERFAQHEVPLEVLKDFAAFEELLMEVAKREYLADHPDRLRIPKGFTKGVELRLAGIEEGSAILSLVLAGLSLSDTAVYVTRAHDKIVTTIANISDGQRPGLPPELLRYFDRFGRSLLEGEQITFRHTEGGQTNLTPEVRQKLLQASQAEEWTEEALLKGRVSEADVANGKFELELPDGTKLRAPLEQQHFETIIAALAAYRHNRMLAVKGVVTKDRSGRFKEFDSVEHVNLLHPLDVETRLEELAKLNPQWFNGKGTALDRTSLTALSEEFEKNFDAALPLPHLYPTPEGDVFAEWTLGPWAVSLEIELKTQAARYEALNLSTDDAEELSLDLSEPSGWASLNDELRKLNISAESE